MPAIAVFDIVQVEDIDMIHAQSAGAVIDGSPDRIVAVVEMILSVATGGRPFAHFGGEDVG